MIDRAGSGRSTHVHRDSVAEEFDRTAAGSDSATNMPARAPRVTIGVPVFNGENFLEQALDAIFEQTYQDFEVIISDNGSSDRTDEICRAYAARDPRIRYFHNVINRGSSWNSNRVFGPARGEYFKWWHHDDLCAPEFLSRCVAALDQDPTAVMACTNIHVIDERGNPIREGIIPPEVTSPSAYERFRRNIQTDHPCLHGHSLIRSRALRETDLLQNCNDADRILFAHLSLLGRCVLIEDPLMFVRDHPSRFTRLFIRDHPSRFNRRIGSPTREAAAWFDPSVADQKLFPYWRDVKEYARAIGRSPLRGRERLRCYGALLVWSRYHKCALIDDLLYYPNRTITLAVSAAKGSRS